MFPVVILGTWLCIHISHGFCLDDHAIASAKEEMCQVGTGYCTHVTRWSFKQWWIPPKISFGHGRWCQISGFLVYLICRRSLRIYGDQRWKVFQMEWSSRWWQWWHFTSEDCAVRLGFGPCSIVCFMLDSHGRFWQRRQCDDHQVRDAASKLQASTASKYGASAKWLDNYESPSLLWGWFDDFNAAIRFF